MLQAEQNKHLKRVKGHQGEGGETGREGFPEEEMVKLEVKGPGRREEEKEEKLKFWQLGAELVRLPSCHLSLRLPHCTL